MMTSGFYLKLLWCILLICSLFGGAEQAPSFGASRSSTLNYEDDYRRLPRGPLLWNEASVVPSWDADSSEDSNVLADVSGTFQRNSSSNDSLATGKAASTSLWGSFLLGFSNSSANVKPSQNSSYVNRTSYLEQAVSSSGGESRHQSLSPRVGAGSLLDAVFQIGRKLSQASLIPLQNVMYSLGYSYRSDGSFPGNHDPRPQGVLASTQMTRFAQGSYTSGMHDISTTTQVIPQSGSVLGQTLNQSGSSLAQAADSQAGYPYINLNSTTNQTGPNAGSVPLQHNKSQVSFSSAQGLWYPSSKDPVHPGIKGVTSGNYATVQWVASKTGFPLSQARGTVMSSAPVQSQGSQLGYPHMSFAPAQTISISGLSPSQPSSSQVVSGPANGLLYPPGFTYDQGAVSSSAQSSYDTYSVSSQSGGAVPNWAVTTFPGLTMVPQADFMTGLVTMPQAGFIPGVSHWDPMGCSSGWDVGYRHLQVNSALAQLAGPVAASGPSRTTEFQVVSAPAHTIVSAIPVNTMVNSRPQSRASAALGQTVVPYGIRHLAHTVSGSAQVVQEPSNFNWQHTVAPVPLVSGASNYRGLYSPGQPLGSWAVTPHLMRVPGDLCLCLKDFRVSSSLLLLISVS